MTDDPPDCLDHETIVLILRREIEPADRLRAEDHMRSCPSCRQLLLIAVRSSLDVSEVRRASRPAMAN